MLNFFYNLLIFPIEQIIELFYVFIYLIFHNTAIAIIGVSLIVSTLTLPLYFMAEKIQNTERDIQKKMQSAVNNIKTAFSGDERYMRLNTYYKQNNYHPLFSLRTSISLAIQIPFFIAAYHFLSNLNALNGAYLLTIKNLSLPDGLLNGINLLPILMTLINVLSAAIYTKGFPLKDKIQLYGMALLFLVLLYNSPAGLVLYWMCNNLYSLIKNILQKTKHSKKIIYISLLLTGVIIIIYCLFLHKGVFTRRIALSIGIIIALSAPFLFNMLKKLNKNKIVLSIASNSSYKIFSLSLIGFVILIGLFIPSGLISSSVEEFASISTEHSVYSYIFITFVQSLGFIVLINCFYLLLNKNSKILIIVFTTIIFFLSLFNSLTFPDTYEHINPDLKFVTFNLLSNKQLLSNTIINICIVTIIIFLLFIKKRFIITTIQTLIIISLFTTSIINLININSDINKQKSDNTFADAGALTLSKTSRNIIYILLDRALPGYLSVLLEEKQELKDSLNGFVFYPNTVSPSRYTIYGLPTSFGGYYYHPAEIQKRNNELLINKISESIQLLPRILANTGYNVITENLPFVNKNAFNDINKIKSLYNESRYNNQYVEKYNIKDINFNFLLNNNLIRFSIFKSSPYILHKLIYDNGNYLSTINNNLNKDLIDRYSFLYYLPENTSIEDNQANNAMIIYNSLPHSTAIFDLPDYTLTNNITNNIHLKKENKWHNNKFYHTTAASIILISKWLDYLKENDVYNNTRIVIVSDHGTHYEKSFPFDFELPNNIKLSYFNSLLLIKDFNADFEFKTDNTFMTNSDFIHVTLEGISDKFINPFTGNELTCDKEKGYLITSNMRHTDNNLYKSRFNIKNNEWLKVHTDIFNPKNWSKHELSY